MEVRRNRHEGRKPVEDRLNEERKTREVKDSARKERKTEETFNIGFFLLLSGHLFPSSLRFQLSLLSLHCFETCNLVGISDTREPPLITRCSEGKTCLSPESRQDWADFGKPVGVSHRVQFDQITGG